MKQDRMAILREITTGPKTDEEKVYLFDLWEKGELSLTGDRGGWDIICRLGRALAEFRKIELPKWEE